ncbi:MAG: type II toxin-antitoxin system Phd/YefM family antitoxin [Hyphomonadaceae bacterium]
MIKVGAFEAKTQFSALLDKVEQGEDVIITRHGKPVARLVKAEAASLEQVDAAIARIKQRREGTTTGGIGWKALRDEGRKY